MRLWKVETASGPVYVQAANEEDAFSYAEARYGKGNVTGTSPAIGTGDAPPGSPILASAGQGSVQLVGKIKAGGDLFDLNRFAQSMDGPTFASNIRQDANYSLLRGGGGAIKTMNAPLGGGGDNTKPDFGDLGADPDAITGRTDNLPSVFREFLRSQNINPFGALGSAATKLQNPLQNMIDLAGAMNINPFIPGQPATERSQSAEEFLNQRGLRSISEGASNVINQMAGLTTANVATQPYLQPDTIDTVDAQAARSAMLAALYKMAPSYAARFGSGAIDRASQMYFDDLNRRGSDQDAGIEKGGFTDDNMIRYIRDQFSPGAFGNKV